MIENNMELKMTSQPILGSTQFLNFRQLTSHLSSESNIAPPPVYNSDIHNKSQNSSSLLEMWQKASTSALADAKSILTFSTTSFLTPSLSSQSHSGLNSNNNNINSSIIKKSNASNNVVTKIIINEGRPGINTYIIYKKQKTVLLVKNFNYL